jgi:hypothetical protein
VSPGCVEPAGPVLGSFASLQSKRAWRTTLTAMSAAGALTNITSVDLTDAVIWSVHEAVFDADGKETGTRDTAKVSISQAGSQQHGGVLNVAEGAGTSAVELPTTATDAATGLSGSADFRLQF